MSVFTYKLRTYLYDKTGYSVVYRNEQFVTVIASNDTEAKEKAKKLRPEYGSTGDWIPGVKIIEVTELAAQPEKGEAE